MEFLLRFQKRPMWRSLCKGVLNPAQPRGQREGRNAGFMVPALLIPGVDQRWRCAQFALHRWAHLIQKGDTITTTHFYEFANWGREWWSIVQVKPIIIYKMLFSLLSHFIIKKTHSTDKLLLAQVPSFAQVGHRFRALNPIPSGRFTNGYNKKQMVKHAFRQPCETRMFQRLACQHIDGKIEGGGNISIKFLSVGSIGQA